MSLGGLFSSPSKQATQAASAEQGISQQDIQQTENYIDSTQQQERAAIAGLGANPYFSAASQVSPSSYAVNPANTASFSSAGPGTTTGAPSWANAFAAPSSPAALPPSAVRTTTQGGGQMRSANVPDTFPTAPLPTPTTSNAFAQRVT